MCTESESSAQDNSESSPGFGHLGISSESSEQALDIRAPQQQHKQTQTD